MKIRKIYLLSTLPFLFSCASMNESLTLGASLGALTGGTATYIAYSTTNRSPSFENVALGTGIGLGVGLLTSYLTHRSVEEKRGDFQAKQTEMHFGDLPPSPFIVPKSSIRKGGAR